MFLPHHLAGEARESYQPNSVNSIYLMHLMNSHKQTNRKNENERKHQFDTDGYIWISGNELVPMFGKKCLQQNSNANNKNNSSG